MSGRQKIEEILGAPFDEGRALELVASVFGERFKAFSRGDYESKDRDSVEIKRAGQVAADDPGGKRIELLFVRVTGDQALRRNRVGLRKAVDSYFSAADAVAGLLAFYYREGEAHWRLGYAWKRARRDGAKGLVVEETDLHRSSYLIGPGESLRTPAERLERLSQGGAARSGLARTGQSRAGSERPIITLAAVEEAFSVEAVSEAFFIEYKRHYESAVAELAKPGNRALFGLPPRKAVEIHGPEAKPLRDFAKKLLGRLVFLKFLEKKGWLGATDYAKADGNRAFLEDLFTTYKRDFYTEALAPLFFETMNRPRKGDLFRLTGTKIPYLNGGLFEPDFENEEDNARVRLSGAFFEALLEFLGRYNFTIDEHDEGDEEIGVDPEMLGRIFERLIEDNEKDMNGTIYTPYAVVEFMCRNSLHLRLCRELDCERDDEKGRALKRLLTHQEIGALTKKDLGRVEKAAAGLKVLDPAVGSGAFPLGMLKELVTLRETLAEEGGEAIDRERLKREIIRSSLYGVDIDPGAVDIARLRLFLALVVDARLPEPLPNLDFKIMQGDSLAEGWEEIPVKFDAAEYRRHRLEKSDGLFETGELERLNRRKQKSATQVLKESGRDVLGILDSYYEPGGDSESRRQNRRLVEELEFYQIRETLATARSARASARDKAKDEHRLHKKPSTEKALAKAEAELAKLETYLADFEAVVAGPRRERPWFLWHYYFHDAFEAGGFDIIIGNPPYRAMQESAGDRAQNRKYPLIDTRIRETFVLTSKAQNSNQIYDLFVRFFRLCLDFSMVAKRSTLLSFITNYAYVDKQNFDGFRKELQKICGNMLIVNLGGDVRANPKLSGPANSIFGIQTGVSISFSAPKEKAAENFELYYCATDELATREEKIAFIEKDLNQPLVYGQIKPSVDGVWINQCNSDFSQHLVICPSESMKDEPIFHHISNGIKSNRDDWVYDFLIDALEAKEVFLLDVFSASRREYVKSGVTDPTRFLDPRIKWADGLKHEFLKAQTISKDSKIVKGLFRAYTTMWQLDSKVFIERRYQTASIFIDGSDLNRVILIDRDSRNTFSVLATSLVFNLHTAGDSLGFPLMFDSRDNITDWSLSLFRDNYKDQSITKEDIFHYVYAVLHNPAYRTKYAEDLKREYPRVPLYRDFRKWAVWGERLMAMHIDFEKQPEAKGIRLYPGEGAKRKTHKAEYATGDRGVRSYSGRIFFSDGSILDGLDPRVFDYRLGNKSAIEWVLDQYSERHWPSDADIAAGRAKPLREDEKVLRDKFNSYRFADYKDYVVSLIKRLQTISLATLDIQEAMAKEEDHGVSLGDVYEKAGDFEDGDDGMSEAAEGAQ